MIGGSMKWCLKKLIFECMAFQVVELALNHVVK